MADVIPFDKRQHQEAQLNLPWYVAGELSAEERARLEAHLAICSECRDDLEFEHQLRAEYPRVPVGVEPAAERKRRGAWGAIGGWFGGDAAGPAWLKVAFAVQSAAVLLLVVVAMPRADEPSYRALGAAPTAGRPAANIVVVFRPDATERDLRAALEAGAARLVDGPLAAGGYLLRAPPEELSAALSALRASAAVASAEPIDTEPEP